MAAYPQVSGPSSRVELRISCKDLIRADILSKSDPMVIAYIDQGGTWAEVSSTAAPLSLSAPPIASK